MRKISIIYFLVAMAGCSSSDVQQVNSYMYQVASIRSNSDSTGMEEATRQVYSRAEAFCAKSERVVETDSLARFDQDMGRPGSATLRFRCINPEASEVSRISRN